MSNTKALSENLENYLEVILELEGENKVARAKDIADRLRLQPGSVTGALKTLSAGGYVNYKPYSFITLTPKGKKIAADIAFRHNAIKDFLVKVLQIENASAEETACRMEHAIDRPTIDRLVCFIEYIFNCPRAGEQWIQSFLTYCDRGAQADCDLCIDRIRTLPQDSSPADR